MGYTKLFPGIIHSTVWRSGKDVQILWVTMLAIADQDGIVEASVPGLSDAARLSLEEVESALGVLLSPDSYSRTKDHEGRRIDPVDGGWCILNYEKYRDKGSLEDVRAKAAARQRRKRERDASRDVTLLSQTVTPVDAGAGDGGDEKLQPRDPPTTHADESRQLEQKRREPQGPGFPDQTACTECDSGPMVLRKGKYGCGWYYVCQACKGTCDADAVGKRRAHKAQCGEGPSMPAGPSKCPCGKPHAEGEALCAGCLAKARR